MVIDTASSYYTGAAGERYHREKRGIPPAAFDWVAAARRQKFAPAIRPVDTVFEFGVGLGWNLAALSCAKKLGFDVAAHLRSEVESRGIAWVEDPAKLAAGSIDVVICHHVLEHLLDPAATLSRLRGLLKPEGRLLLVVPAENRGEGRHYHPEEPNRHLFCWNPQTLGNLLAVCGLEPKQIGLHRYGYDRFAASLAVRLRGGEPLFRAIRATAQTLRPLYEVRTIARATQSREQGPAIG